MLFVIRAYAGTLAVIGIPGLLVASMLRLRLRVLSTWAAIPALSLATVFILGEVTTLFRIPFGVPAFVLLLVVLGCLLASRRLRPSVRARQPERVNQGGPARASNGARLQQYTDYALLVIGVAVGAFTWLRGLRGVPLVIPGADATRQAWFVGRVLYGHTVDLSKVLTYDAAGKHATANYYPLALHAAAALSTRLAGSDVGRVLVAYVVLFSVVVLPVGMFVLARTLSPSRPLVAGFTALVVPMLVLFPYWPVWAGDVPQIVAMALVPVSVVLLRNAMLARNPRIGPRRAFAVASAPAALAILCTISVHTSEFPLIVFLVLLLVCERAWRKRDARMLVPAVVRGLCVGGLALALFAPTLASFAGGVSERAPIRAYVQENSRNWAPTLGTLLQLHYGAGTIRQGFLMVLAIVGVALCLSWRRPAWVCGLVGVIFLTLWASASSNRLADHLTFPWYHLDVRIVPNLAFFVPYFAGVALAYGVVVITRLARRRQAFLPAALVMLGLLTLFVGLHGSRAASAYVQASFSPRAKLFRNQALVTHPSLEAFQWLHNHVAPGDTVANEPYSDGSLWMYAEQDVAPLTGYYNTNVKPSPDLSDRLYLADDLPLLGRDPRVDELARRYHTRWIYFDKHVLRFPKRVVRLHALRSDPNLKVVFRESGVLVFRIDLPARA